jgi:uncharacterized protein (DUF1330 family)
MLAYLIGNITVTDPTRYAEYSREVPAVIAAHGGRYLVRGGAVQEVEGSPGLNRTVVLEFADMATLRAFYDSPDYAPLRALRAATTVSHVALVEGYVG